jgi:hypothetical protein
MSGWPNFRYINPLFGVLHTDYTNYALELGNGSSRSLVRPQQLCARNCGRQPTKIATERVLLSTMFPSTTLRQIITGNSCWLVKPSSRFSFFSLRRVEYILAYLSFVIQSGQALFYGISGTVQYSTVQYNEFRSPEPVEVKFLNTNLTRCVYGILENKFRATETQVTYLITLPHPEHTVRRLLNGYVQFTVICNPK